MERITYMFKALSDGTRLRIMNLLLERELCVCQVTSVLRSTQSRTSRHLAYLKNAGFVKSRRKGLWVYYSLIKPKGHAHRGLLDAVRRSREELGLLRRDIRKLEGVSLTATCSQEV